MLEILDDYDWACAFEYAGEVTHHHGNGSPQPTFGYDGSTDEFTREDVEEVIGLHVGERDYESWCGVFKLKDGRFAYLEAGCDYTGWD